MHDLEVDGLYAAHDCTARPAATSSACARLLGCSVRKPLPLPFAYGTGVANWSAVGSMGRGWVIRRLALGGDDAGDFGCGGHGVGVRDIWAGVKKNCHARTARRI